MTTMLRHTPTGELYPYNADLARRDDMVQYTPPPEGAVETPVEKPKPKAKVVKQAKKAPEPEPEVDLDDDFSDLADELDELK
jgi:outer membrane biosynthesis protein TonB